MKRSASLVSHSAVIATYLYMFLNDCPFYSGMRETLEFLAYLLPTNLIPGVLSYPSQWNERERDPGWVWSLSPEQGCQKVLK